jgi:hypothetical protein
MLICTSRENTASAAGIGTSQRQTGGLEKHENYTGSTG